MEAIQATDRQFSSGTVGRIRLGHSKFLIPDMNRATTPLLAATLRAFDIDAHILPTYKGLDFGRKFTSGKECFPCLVTLGDLLYFIEEERERLGQAFNAGRYVFFMPETEGPCRFGMYNKFQRIVLDSLPELKALRITAATTTDGYSPEGIFDAEHIRSSGKPPTSRWCWAMSWSGSSGGSGRTRRRPGKRMRWPGRPCAGWPGPWNNTAPLTRWTTC